VSIYCIDCKLSHCSKCIRQHQGHKNDYVDEEVLGDSLAMLDRMSEKLSQQLGSFEDKFKLIQKSRETLNWQYGRFCEDVDVTLRKIGEDVKKKAQERKECIDDQLVTLFNRVAQPLYFMYLARETFRVYHGMFKVSKCLEHLQEEKYVLPLKELEKKISKAVYVPENDVIQLKFFELDHESLKPQLKDVVLEQLKFAV